MKVQLDRSILNESYLQDDNITELFKFDLDKDQTLNEDLLKFSTGVLASGLGMAAVKAVQAHNLIELKRYMSKVTNLVINGKDKWKEPTFKGVINDEKRNVLLITFELAKFAGIYDFQSNSSSMPNSKFAKMPKIAGGSDSNFKKLLQRRTKWFGLKTVSDPLKNLKSIKPEKKSDPNSYFSSMLEQYRNALNRVFGEEEGRQIADAISSAKSGGAADSAKFELEGMTGSSYDQLVGMDNSSRSMILQRNPSASRLYAEIRRRESLGGKDLTDQLSKIFNDVCARHDMMEYTVFKDMNSALDGIVSSYDKTIQEAISNNRLILDKKLKKDGLMAMWLKYMNNIKKAKQPAIDEFNKSVEYTYLKDFLRGSMITLFVKLINDIKKVGPKPGPTDPSKDPSADPSTDPSVDPSVEPSTDQDPSLSDSFSVYLMYSNKVEKNPNASSNESYVFDDVIESILNEEDEEPKYGKDDETITIHISPAASGPKVSVPAPKTVTFFTSTPEEKGECLEKISNKAKGMFNSSDAEVSVGGMLSWLGSEYNGTYDFSTYLNENPESEAGANYVVDLNAQETVDDIGFNKEKSPNFKTLTYLVDASFNLRKEKDPILEYLDYKDRWEHEPSTFDSSNSSDASQDSSQDSSNSSDASNASLFKLNLNVGENTYSIGAQLDDAMKSQEYPVETLIISEGRNFNALTEDDLDEIFDKGSASMWTYKANTDKECVCIPSNTKEIAKDGMTISMNGIRDLISLNTVTTARMIVKVGDKYVFSDTVKLSEPAEGTDDDFSIEIDGETIFGPSNESEEEDFSPILNEDDEDTEDSSENVPKVKVGEKMDIKITTTGDGIKGALVVFTKDKIEKLDETFLKDVIAKKYPNCGIIAGKEDNGKYTISETLTKANIGDCKFGYVIPRTEASNVVNAKNTLLDKAKMIELVQDVGANMKITGAAIGDQFKIEVKDFGDSSYLGIVLGSNEADFAEDGKAVKGLEDALSTASKDDQIKILAGDDSYSAVFANCKSAKNGVLGIKFNSGYIVFEQPGDFILFKAFPISYDGKKFDLDKDGSPVGKFTMQQQPKPKDASAVQPNAQAAPQATAQGTAQAAQPNVQQAQAQQTSTQPQQTAAPTNQSQSQNTI